MTLSLRWVSIPQLCCQMSACMQTPYGISDSCARHKPGLRAQLIFYCKLPSFSLPSILFKRVRYPILHTFASATSSTQGWNDQPEQVHSLRQMVMPSLMHSMRVSVRGSCAANRLQARTPARATLSTSVLSTLQPSSTLSCKGHHSISLLALPGLMCLLVQKPASISAHARVNPDQCASMPQNRDTELSLSWALALRQAQVRTMMMRPPCLTRSTHAL